MKFPELIIIATECVQAFNPVTHTIDTHSDEFLKNIKDPYEKVFLK